jgi:hypothetical protein
MKKQKTNKLAFCALIENTLPSHIILQYERKRELLLTYSNYCKNLEKQCRVSTATISRA